MIAGLEFLKSWRFWAMLTAWTSAVTLASAGAQIAATLYFPLVDGKPDDLYHAMLALPLFAFIAGLAAYFTRQKARGSHYRAGRKPPLYVGVVAYFTRQEARESRYPAGRKPPLYLGVVVAATFVVILEDLAVTWFLLQPVLGADTHLFLSFLLAFLFGTGFGENIAKKVQAGMPESSHGE